MRDRSHFRPARRAAAAAALALVCTAGGAWAQGADDGASCRASQAPPRARPSVSLILENDAIQGPDRDYTNGLGVMYSGPLEDCWPLLGLTARADRLFGRLVFDFLPGVSEGGEWRPASQVTATLAQQMFTPLDIDRANPDPADRPYAGWLYGSIGYIGEAERPASPGSPVTVRLLSVTRLDLGIVGPASGAGALQRFYHRVMEFDHIPSGWDYQLSNEPGLVVRHERTVAAIRDLGPFQVEASANAGLALGNVITDASAGAGLRFGRNVRVDYGPPRFRPGLSGPNTFTAGGGNWAAYVFVTGGGRAVARNIFLDGNTFADSRSVEKRNFVWEYQMGAAIAVSRVKVSATRVTRSEEFVGQNRDTVFHSLSLSVRL